MTDEQKRDLVKECGLDWQRGYMPLFDDDPTNRYAVLIDAAVAAERERLAPGALRDVAAERRRQIEVEGWMPDHDDRHRDGSLAKAAYCYAWAACGLGMESPPPAPPGWPWAATWWKPRDARSNLVRAAALLLAEIERLDRQSPAGEKT